MCFFRGAPVPRVHLAAVLAVVTIVTLRILPSTPRASLGESEPVNNYTFSRGGGCKSLFRAFKRSSGHRANILGTWKHVGVGLDRRGGNIFVMHIFQSKRNPGNVYNY